MRVTPSPRILKMLGQIEFQEWQCLAELIDNSIDALRQASKDEHSGLSKSDYCVEVHLPETQNDRNATVEVIDHAPGMTRERLEQAVRAGWSGNDQFDQLGLFGMGFNISTARLGRVTRVVTTRRSQESWIGVEIDLDRIGHDFEATDVVLPKDEPDQHGTRVIIGALDSDRANWLARRHNALRTKLGHIYSWILTNTPIQLRVNGRLVEPKRLCAWSENRQVCRGSGRNVEVIPAHIPIDQELGEADACSACGSWQQLGHDRCQSCGASDIAPRKRRIHGWVGIQRYLHSNNFGIDFVRNGRKIVISDKDVFSWTDPNNPSAAPEREYPLEVPADQGRIIGEIHLDHVPVHYMKNRFDTESRAWKSAIEFLRGPGPLKPQRAKQLGYPENESPIGRLFRGYRRNDPGTSYLVPGDGMRAIHQQAAEWGLKFDRGDADFQDDSKWWDAVVFHEQQKEARNARVPLSDNEADKAAVLRALQGGTAPSPHENKMDGPISPPPETEHPRTLHEKVQTLLERSRAIPSISREIHCRSLGESVDVAAYQVETSPLVDGNNEAHTAIWLCPGKGGSANIFVDPNHEAFTVHGMAVLDVAIAQISHFLLVRAGSVDRSISQIMCELRRENFPDEKTDFVTIQNRSRDLLDRIRSELVKLIAEDPQRAWRMLDENEIVRMERNVVLRGRTGAPLDSDDPSFVEDAPAVFLLRLFQDWPDIFLDGKIFSAKFNQLQDSSSRQICKARISSLLIDVVAIASEERNQASINQLRRAALAIEMLQSELD